ncbi:uncharacterized protein METZ01_LOCUS235731 [marine metagenome]|uniref:Uncharacterized protein n=1 Tax=marine metagenome TaxID=408172 RepID=A0A382H7I9_9ZZZZ
MNSESVTEMELNAMRHYGGDPFAPERLLEEISKVNYSGINWKKLKI